MLDGALDRALSEPEMLSEEARTAENQFVRLAGWCKRSAMCPLHGRNVLRIWDRLIKRANRSPIPAAKLHRRVTGQQIHQAADVSYLLFKHPSALSPVSWLALGPAIVKALHGDASGFASAVPPPPHNPAYGSRAIECLDFPVQATNFAEFPIGSGSRASSRPI